jgi:hypothetical protein
MNNVEDFWDDEYVRKLQDENKRFKELLTEFYQSQTNMDFWVRVGEALGLREEE